MECAECGAPLDPSARECAYCRAPTPRAERLIAEERARLDRVAAEREKGARRERSADTEKLEHYADRTFAFALVGMVLCCVPVFSVASFVWFVRARALARRLSVDLPWKATSGVALSILSVVLFSGGLVWAFVRDSQHQEKAEARIAVLEAQVAAGTQKPVLDWATACGLGELYALKNGQSGERGQNLVNFECSGNLVSGSGRPVLEHLSFRNDPDDKRFDVSVCFERGARWYVRELNANHVCPSATTSATPGSAR